MIKDDVTDEIKIALWLKLQLLASSNTIRQAALKSIYQKSAVLSLNNDLYIWLQMSWVVLWTINFRPILALKAVLRLPNEKGTIT